MIRYPKYKFFYAGLDFSIIAVSFYFAKIIYDLFYLTKLQTVQPLNAYDTLYIIISIFVFIFIFHYNNLYKLNIFLTRALHLSLILKSLLYGLILHLIASFFFKIDFVSSSRLYIVIFFYVSIVMFVIFRVLLMRKLYKERLSDSFFKRKILIIGTGKSARFFAEKMLFEYSLGVKIIGFADDEEQSGTPVFRGLKVLGNTDELESLIKDNDVNEIVICMDNINYEELLVLIDKCNKFNVSTRLTSELFKVIPERMFPEYYSDLPVIDASHKVNMKVYLKLKRILDYLGAVFGILVLSPFFLITSFLIKFSSTGPIILRQVRIGKNGRHFNFYKFRTMTVIEGEDTERQKNMLAFMKNGNGTIKIINEKRVTGIGRFLRKYSLDELPQLFNVIKGDMSLVGPRPCLPYEYENYDEWQKRRLRILPGCTGLWQVTGRSNTTFNDSVIIDIFYINNVTPWLDVQLIFQTIPVMLFARGGK